MSIIAILVYQINSTSKEIQLRSKATYLAINEIENIKNQGFEAYKDRSISGGNSIVTQDEEVQEGYFKTTTIIDYTDIQGNEEKTKDCKKATVKISYMYKAKEQTVELSTVLSKES